MSAPKSRPKSRRPGQFTGKDDPRNGRGRGPKPGAPNAGRLKDIVRAALANDLKANCHILAQFVADESLSPETRMRALDLMAKYGLGTQQEVEQDREVTIRVVRDEPPAEKKPAPERSPEAAVLASCAPAGCGGPSIGPRPSGG